MHIRMFGCLASRNVKFGKISTSLISLFFHARTCKFFCNCRDVHVLWGKKQKCNSARPWNLPPPPRHWRPRVARNLMKYFETRTCQIALHHRHFALCTHYILCTLANFMKCTRTVTIHFCFIKLFTKVPKTWRNWDVGKINFLARLSLPRANDWMILREWYFSQFIWSRGLGIGLERRRESSSSSLLQHPFSHSLSLYFFYFTFCVVCCVVVARWWWWCFVVCWMLHLDLKWCIRLFILF